MAPLTARRTYASLLNLQSHTAARLLALAHVLGWCQPWMIDDDEAAIDVALIAWLRCSIIAPDLVCLESADQREVELRRPAHMLILICDMCRTRES